MSMNRQVQTKGGKCVSQFVAFTHLSSVFLNQSYYNQSKTLITMMLLSMFNHVETIDISTVSISQT